MIELCNECNGEPGQFRLGKKIVCKECFDEHKNETFRLSNRVKNEKNRRTLKFRDKWALG
jgi:reverse gyrase